MRQKGSTWWSLGLIVVAMVVLDHSRPFLGPSIQAASQKKSLDLASSPKQFRLKGSENTEIHQNNFEPVSRFATTREVKDYISAVKASAKLSGIDLHKILRANIEIEGQAHFLAKIKFIICELNLVNKSGWQCND